MVHVFCIDILFLQRNRVYEICQRRDRYSPFPSHLEAASDPDARQPAPSCALQPPRSMSRDYRPHIALSLPVCTQQAPCRGAAPVSRRDPLPFRSNKRCRSKAFFFRCAQRNIGLRSRTCQFVMRPRNLGLRTSQFRVDRKRCLLCLNQLLLSRRTCTAARLASRTRGGRLL